MRACSSSLHEFTGRTHEVLDLIHGGKSFYKVAMSYSMVMRSPSAELLHGIGVFSLGGNSVVRGSSRD